MVNGELRAFTEYERRETYVATLDSFEKKLFLSLVQETLHNDPDERPTSRDVMKRLEEILSKIPNTEPVSAQTTPNGSKEATDSARAAALSRQLEVTTPTLYTYQLLIQIRQLKSHTYVHLYN